MLRNREVSLQGNREFGRAGVLAPMFNHQGPSIPSRTCAAFAALSHTRRFEDRPTASRLSGPDFLPCRKLGRPDSVAREIPLVQAQVFSRGNAYRTFAQLKRLYATISCANQKKYCAQKTAGRREQSTSQTVATVGDAYDNTHESGHRAEISLCLGWKGQSCSTSAART